MFDGTTGGGKAVKCLLPDALLARDVRHVQAACLMFLAWHLMDAGSTAERTARARRAGAADTEQLVYHSHSTQTPKGTLQESLFPNPTPPKRELVSLECLLTRVLDSLAANPHSSPRHKTLQAPVCLVCRWCFCPHGFCRGEGRRGKG